MRKPALTRKDASDITQLLMACYHEGVCDAWAAQDDAFCRQFVSDCRREGSLGCIDVKGVGKVDYVYTILIYCRKYRLERLGRDVVMPLKGYSPLLDLCMEFYLEGVSDYVSAPDFLAMDDYKDNTKALWGRAEKVGDLRNYVIKKASEYGVAAKRRDKVSAFVYTLWLLTRPIGSGIKR